MLSFMLQIPRVGARPADRAGPFYEDTAGVEAFCFKFPGADAAVVRSTQNSLASRGEVSTQRCEFAGTVF